MSKHPSEVHASAEATKPNQSLWVGTGGGEATGSMDMMKSLQIWNDIQHDDDENPDHVYKVPVERDGGIGFVRRKDCGSVAWLDSDVS
jgi:hypothetical protein